jgi:hypothetical protein
VEHNDVLYKVEFDVPNDGFIYLRADDPFVNPEYGVFQVIRSDGKVLPRDNGWRTYRILRYELEPEKEEALLHIFDHNTTGSYDIILKRDYGTTGTTGRIIFNWNFIE